MKGLKIALLKGKLIVITRLLTRGYKKYILKVLELEELIASIVARALIPAKKPQPQVGRYPTGTLVTITDGYHFRYQQIGEIIDWIAESFCRVRWQEDGKIHNYEIDELEIYW